VLLLVVPLLPLLVLPLPPLVGAQEGHHLDGSERRRVKGGQTFCSSSPSSMGAPVQLAGVRVGSQPRATCVAQPGGENPTTVVVVVVVVAAAAASAATAVGAAAPVAIAVGAPAVAAAAVVPAAPSCGGAAAGASLFCWCRPRSCCCNTAATQLVPLPWKP
jgi:hypothetical protein